MDRRLFILLLLSLGCAAALPAAEAHAKDGEDDDGGGDSGGSGSSSGGSGSDSRSSDDSRSGRDKSEDRDRGEKRNDDGARSEDRSGSGRGSRDDRNDDKKDGENDDRSGRSARERDQKEAREAVKRGEILPLKDILKRVDDEGGGRVIGVDLNMRALKPFYTLKVQRGSSVKTLKFEAATGRKLNIFGW
ncbi:hypothetical protein H6M51_00825 [Rhizobium sp. AQ_MP]|uniref:hypothetical protein n=1 Tax=Rhizobium sp. AQ_MP TaxID=2761536 RepID=UPI00163A6BD1|nr:hypothetical protein [Rhizobium sp. AQ_MP]MBC2771384.1 hypothetical protein [Rhizobium sp. AQ_MP]